MGAQAPFIFLGLIALALLMLSKLGKALCVGFLLLLGCYLLWIWSSNPTAPAKEDQPSLWEGLNTVVLLASTLSFCLAGVIASVLSLQIKVERIQREARQKDKT
jgi:hypothetical protein